MENGCILFLILMKNTWHTKTLKRYIKDTFKSTLTYLLIILVLLVWNFVLDIRFEWQPVELFTPPSIFHRIFYSALVFCTFGRALYYMGVYKFLHDIIVKGFGMWGLYNAIKAIMWSFMVYGSYFYVVPWFFKALNSTTSFFINVANIILYISKPIGIALILVIIYKLCTTYLKLNDPIVVHIDKVFKKLHSLL
jgi:hypothetical protein